MKKILIGLVAVAMLVGFAMAREKAWEDMTVQEKYAHAREVFRADREAGRLLFDEIKDNEGLHNNLRANAYFFADEHSVEYARQTVALATETHWARGNRLAHMLVNATSGEEQEGYINEMVRLAGQWSNQHPYESTVIPLLVQRDRIDDAKAVAKIVLESPHVGVTHISRAMSVLEPKEGLDILIGNFPNLRTSDNFVPAIDEKTGKLNDESSIVGIALDLIASSDISLEDKDKYLTRIAGSLSVRDPAQRIMLEAVLSERDAVRKIMG